VLTDGIQTADRGPFTALDVASAPIKALKAKVYAVGIGSAVDKNELLQIASSPENALIVSSFKKLDEKIIQLRTAGCKGEGIRKER
jgi:hypothetical protein